jgi:hypothetical protein
MNDLRFTLTTDGSSDAVLLQHLYWLLRQHLNDSITIQPQWADLRSLSQKPRDLSDRIISTLDLFPCDILFIHRDAERQDPTERSNEISGAIEKITIDVPSVSVVPIRMTEAWLLFDEQAIRIAAGNPNGDEEIDIPYQNVESLADPKQYLHDILRTASGLTGRRRKKFDPHKSMRRIAEFIDDFSPLRSVPAFRNLECDLINILKIRGWLDSADS